MQAIDQACLTCRGSLLVMFRVMFIITDSVITDQEQKRYGIISGHETIMHF